MAKGKNNLVQSLIYAGLGLVSLLLITIMALLLYALVGEQLDGSLMDMFSDASILERTLDHPGVQLVQQNIRTFIG